MSIVLPESLVKRYGVQFKTGDIIFCEFEKGNHCYFLQNGVVQILKLYGKQRILDIIEPGNFFGEMAVFENLPRSATAMAKSTVFALRFTQMDFVNLIHTFPELPYQLLVILSNRILDAKRRLKSLSINDSETRIVDTILYLTEKQTGNKISKDIYLKLTIDELSQWCGISEEETLTIIESLTLRNALHYASERIYIHNLDSLRLLSRKKKENG